MRRPLFASSEGSFFGGFTSCSGKSHAVGVLAKIRISKAHGVLAGTVGVRQAFAKINKIMLGYFAIRSVSHILKFVHVRTLSFNDQNVNSVISLFCSKGKSQGKLHARGSLFAFKEGV
jgi:hypothetical protein